MQANGEMKMDAGMMVGMDRMGGFGVEGWVCGWWVVGAMGCGFVGGGRGRWCGLHVFHLKCVHKQIVSKMSFMIT